MKAVIILLLTFLLSACKQEIDTKLLIGTWRAADNKENTVLNSYSTITFSNNDSIIADTYTFGKITSQISGKYEVDQKSGILTTMYGDSITYHLEISELTADKLDLYYPETKQHQSYSKLKF
jgi:hypothetical protein